MDDVKSNYVLTTIDQVNDSFLKAMIFGKVIEKGEDYVLLDDGTSAIKVIYNHEQLDSLAKVEIGDNLMVLGKVVRFDKGLVIFADITRILVDFKLKELISLLKSKRE